MKLKLIFIFFISIIISCGLCDQIETENVTTTTESTLLEESEETYSRPKQNSTFSFLTEKSLQFQKKKFSEVRNPKFGFNLPINFPTIPGLNDINSGGGIGGNSPYQNYFGGGGSSSSVSGSGSNNVNDGGLDSSTKLVDGGIGLASTVALIKGGVLGGLTALKAAILPPIFIVGVIAFLIAGTAFFACNVIDCQNFLGSSGSSPLSSLTNFFSRNGQEPYYYGSPNTNDYYTYYENQIQPVYQALEDAYKKYEGTK